MVGKVKFMKTKWYPRPHQENHSVTLSMEESTKHSTIFPICFYDEGMGTPSAYEANPEHASFVEAAMGNCFPKSTIDFVIASVEMSMTKGCLETDKIHALKVGVMPIFLSFDDYLAKDELSSLEIQDVLEMQTESTDRQGFPLYNGAKLSEKFAGSATLNAAQDGLTTTQIIENVAFNYNQYYDNLHYLTTSEKLKVCQGGLKWITLTKNRPTARYMLKLRSKVKSMQQFGFFGVLITLPQASSHYQIPVTGDTTVIPHVEFRIRSRFNEWNQEFNFKFV